LVELRIDILFQFQVTCW